MSLKFEFTADEVVESGRVAEQDLDEIVEWLERDNLPKAGRELVVLFLLSCENDLERTKSTILAYYKTKYMGPKIFNERDMFSKELNAQTALVESCMIPRRTKDNCQLLLQRLKNYSHWSFNIESAMKYLFMTLDIALQGKPAEGLIVLFDMKGLGLLHLTKLRVGALKIFFQYVQEALPIKIKGIHVFNSTYFVDKLITIIKPFMKKELYEMLHFHPPSLNMEDFFESYVEAECVPSDYGGKLPSVKTLEEVTLEKMRKVNQWFEFEEELRKGYKPKK